MDGSNNMTGSGDLTDLADFPSSYTQAHTIYTANSTPNAMIESGVTLTTNGSNEFLITRGTAILTCIAGTNKLRELTVGAASFNIDTSGYAHPITAADLGSPSNSIYYSSTTSKLTYKDPGGTAHVLY